MEHDLSVAKVPKTFGNYREIRGLERGRALSNPVIEDRWTAIMLAIVKDRTDRFFLRWTDKLVK